MTEIQNKKQKDKIDSFQQNEYIILKKKFLTIITVFLENPNVINL